MLIPSDQLREAIEHGNRGAIKELGRFLDSLAILVQLAQKVYDGRGVVRIDETGISIQAGSGMASLANSYRFHLPDNQSMGGLKGWYTSTTLASMLLELNTLPGRDGDLSMQVSAPAGKSATLTLNAIGNNGGNLATVELLGGTGSNDQIILSADSILAYGTIQGLLGDTGEMAQNSSTVKTVALDPGGLYLLHASLSGPNTDVRETVFVDSPFTSNINCGFASMLSDTYSLGSISVATQNGGGKYALNANSNNQIKITFNTGAHGTDNATWFYRLVRLCR